MITTEDVRRASRTGETLHVGPIELTLEYLVRLPATDWDDWIELHAFAARREAKRLRFAVRYIESSQAINAELRRLAAGVDADTIEGEVVPDKPAIEGPPRVRKRAASTQA